MAYENPWVRCEVHAIVHPNGHPGEHAVIVTPVASAVVVLDGDDVILTRQPRYALDRVVLEVVKGGAEPGETPLACVQRELAEELGLRAQRWESLGTAYEIPSIVREPVHLFLARELVHGEARPDAIESITAERLPFAQALAAVAAGEIDDAVTALALLRAAHALGRV